MIINGYRLSERDQVQAYDTAATVYPSSLEPDRQYAVKRGDARMAAILTLAVAYQEQWFKQEKRLDQATWGSTGRAAA